MSKDSNDILEVYEAAEDTGLDPDVIDTPLPDVQGEFDETDTELDIDELSEIDLLESVMKRGSVMFSEGRMLTSCPGYNEPAVCGMYPLPHPGTGDAIMVCTGPVITKTQSVGIFGPSEEYYTVKKPRYDCPYHPDRINEPPNYDENDSRNEGGWL